MNDFTVGQEPPREPAGMKVVGTGVIVSCLLLSTLFAWGIYLDLTADPCTCPTVEGSIIEQNSNPGSSDAGATEQ